MKKLLIIGFLMAGLLIAEASAWAKKSVFWFTIPVCQQPHGSTSPCMYDEELCHYCDASLGVGATSNQNGNISFTLKLRNLNATRTVLFTSETFEQTEQVQTYNLKEIFWPAFIYGGLLEVTINSDLEILAPALEIMPVDNKSLLVLPLIKKRSRK